MFTIKTLIEHLQTFPNKDIPVVIVDASGDDDLLALTYPPFIQSQDEYEPNEVYTGLAGERQSFTDVLIINGNL